MLPQYSLPLRTGDTNIYPLESSNFLRLSTTDYSNFFDLNHSLSPTDSSGHNTGRRPRRNKTNLSRGTSASKPRDGGVLGNLLESQYQLLHARKTPSKRVHRALHHSYYSALSTGDENFQAILEEYVGGVECSSASKPLYVTGIDTEARQGQEPDSQPSRHPR
ncbi:hypothetical protein FXO37_06595 [Capsicum annuum]|nr:hypothetical protein FXO37_06595 [Capsicum annuum]